MSIVVALIVWEVSLIVSHLLEPMSISGMSMGFLVRITSTLIWGIFMIHALSDALVLGDLAIAEVLPFFGLREEKSSKRTLKDLIYIIAAILAVAGISPLLSNLGDVGSTLQTITTFIVLGIITLLVYDIGRVLHRVFREKANLMAERLGVENVEGK